MLSQNVLSENVKPKSKAFGLSDKIGYMFGDLGNCFYFRVSQ
jgi:GPH family glycoside/pentoside/hexuronide:cation symporter